MASAVMFGVSKGANLGPYSNSSSNNSSCSLFDLGEFSKRKGNRYVQDEVGQGYNPYIGGNNAQIFASQCKILGIATSDIRIESYDASVGIPCLQCDHRNVSKSKHRLLRLELELEHGEAGIGEKKDLSLPVKELPHLRD